MAAVAPAGGTHGIQKDSSLLELDSYELAALLVQDAIAGRLDNGMAAMKLRSQTARRCFALYTSQLWTYFIYICLCAQMLLGFEEPSASFVDNPSPDWKPWTIATEASFLAVLLLDMALKMRFMGLHMYVSKTWHKKYMALLFLHVIDMLLLAAGTGRPFRCLRGVGLLLRSRTLRRICGAIIGVWDVLLVWSLWLFGLLLVFAAVRTSSSHDTPTPST
eukprot:6205000-Pleurochrysis_carterae.AAC.2